MFFPPSESNLEKASDVTFDEVMTESPHQQTPNSKMASLTHTNFVLIPEQIHSDPDVPELYVPEQTVPEQQVPEQAISNQSSATNTILEPKITTNDQPFSSNLALQACAPAKTTNVPSPPTLFLDSSILPDVCENIFQELNKLIIAMNNLVHEDNYV